MTFAVNYFLKPASDPSVLSNWGTNADGTGTAPGSFTITAGTDVFTIPAGVTGTMGAGWTLSASQASNNQTTTVTLLVNGVLNTNGQTLTLNATTGHPNATANISMDVSSSASLFFAPGGQVLATQSATNGVKNVSFTLQNGATLRTANASGLSGSVPVTNFTTYSIGIGNFEYNGASQSMGLPVGVTTVNNLIFSGSGTKTMNATTNTINGAMTVSGTATVNSGVGLSIAGALSIGSGTTFNASTFTHTLNGNFSNSGTFTQGSSTLNFTGTAAQTIGGSSTTTFNNLTINNTNVSGVSLNTPVNVNAVLNIPGSRTFNLQSHTLGGSTLTTTGTGLMRTQNTTATPIPAGRTWSFWVEYDYAGETVAAQTAVAGTFANLRVNSLHGAKASGNITVNTELHLPRANPAQHASNNPENAHGALEMVKQYTAHTGSDALEYGNYADVYTPYSKEFSFSSTTMSVFKFSDTYEIGVDDIYEITSITSADHVELRNKNTGDVITVSLADFNSATVPDSDPAEKLYNRSGIDVAIVNNENNVTNTPAGIQDRLDSHYLDLGATAIITGIGDVTGKVRRSSISNSIEYAFGNTNTTLRFNLNGGTTADLPTSVVVFITKGSVRGLHPNRTNTVQRLHQVVRTGGAAPVTFDLKLSYLPEELNGIPETRLVLWDHHIPYSTNNTPHEHGRTSIDTLNNWVQLSGHGIAYLNTNESAIGLIGGNPATPNRKKYWMMYETSTITNNWLGATPTDGVFRFDDSFNWTKGIVPSANDDVVIPSTAVNAPNIVTVPNSVTLKTLTVDPGATLSLPENVVVTIKGGITVAGGRPSLTNRGNISFGTGSKIIFDYSRTANTVVVDDQTVPVNETAFISGDIDLEHLEVVNNTYLRAATAANVVVRGNILKTSGNIDFDTNPNTLTFNSNSAQAILKPDGGNGGYHHLVFKGSGSKTLPENSLPIHGDFIDSTSITSSSALVFPSNSIIKMAGSIPQKIAAAHPIQFKSLNIANKHSAIVVEQNISLDGDLTISSGAILDLGYAALSGTISTLLDTGTVKTRHALTTLPFPAKSWNSVLFYNTDSVQTIPSGASFNKLSVSNPIGVLASSTLEVADTLLISGEGVLDMNSNSLSGVGLNTAGSGKLVTKALTNALPAGRSWSFEVDYNADNVIEEDESVTQTEQVISHAAAYKRLKLSGSGKKLLTNDTEVVVEDELTISSSDVFLEIAPAQKLNAISATVINNGGNQGIRILAESNAPNASFLFGNSSGSVPARVQLYSKANLDGATYNWQYVGFPTSGYSRSTLPPGSFIAAFDESTQSYFGPTTIEPFRGYAITHNTVGRSFEFDGEISNQNQIIPLSYTALQQDGLTPTPEESRGFNMIANSFTAAVTIDQLDFTNAESTVWLFNTGVNTDGATGDGVGQYIAVPSALAAELGVTQISSLQGFYVKATSQGASVTIPYAAATTMNVNPMRVPLIEDEKVYSIVEVVGARFSDKVWLFTQEDTSDAYDDGWDGRKLFGVSKAPQLFAVGPDDRYQVKTTNDIHNLKLGFRKGEDDLYTLRFHHHNSQMRYPRLWLMDLLEGAIVDISTNGAEYQFYETRVEADERFKIVVEYDQTTELSDQLFIQNLNIGFSEGRLHISNATDVEAVIMVYDALGKSHQRINVRPNQHLSELLALPAGMYFIRAVSHRTVTPLRIILN